MIKVDPAITPLSLVPAIERMWQASAAKIVSIEESWQPSHGAPVFTINGKYTSRGWTEWTQGFQFGAAILQFDSTGDSEFLEMGRKRTVECMASHVSHIGVHDHGFNNVSTYGNLLRLMQERRIADNAWEKNFYELALKLSGAVQAARWSTIAGGGGYIYSFNGPHSLFVDTIRSLRALAVAHRLGHVLTGENDARISLLERIYQHAEATAKYSVYYGEGRDSYDLPELSGRTVHESIFNRNDGNFRCPSSQQGYSPFTTWTRGLAWAMCGFAEQLEFLDTLTEEPPERIRTLMRRAALATCDFYLAHTPTCGVPYWDTGAPNLHKLGDYLGRPAEPFNDFEPVDSSAAAIAAQGLIRFGRWLARHGEDTLAATYFQAGFTVLKTILEEPYLSTDAGHQGLLLHSVYHRPNGWDNIPEGFSVPCNESCMWGDYHLREVALLVQRMGAGRPYLTFWS
jgi:unsaturated chondroitin disaccharide hydrolase